MTTSLRRGYWLLPPPCSVLPAPCLYPIASANSRKSAARARAPWAPSTITFTRTSVVLINSTLIPSLAKAAKQPAGHARCGSSCPRRRPKAWPPAGSRPAAGSPAARPARGSRGCDFSRSPCGTVKEMFVRPSRPTFCTIMSTTTPACGHFVEDLGGQARHVGHGVDRHAGLRLVQGDVLDDQLFHLLHAGDHVVRAAGGRRRRAALRNARRAPWPSSNSAWTVRRASRAYSRRHEHRNLDLAGGDHLDVDALLGQRAEHPLGDARLRGHAQPDDRDLRHVVVAVVAPRRRVP